MGKQQGICQKTARRIWKDGRLPVEVNQLPTGTPVLAHPPVEESKVFLTLYARVASHDQKNHLDVRLAWFYPGN